MKKLLIALLTFAIVSPFAVEAKDNMKNGTKTTTNGASKKNNKCGFCKKRTCKKRECKKEKSCNSCFLNCKKRNRNGKKTAQAA